MCGFVECRNVGVIRNFCFLAIALLFVFNYNQFVNFQNEEDAVKLLKQSRIAAVYAGPTFHDEVVSSVACVLKDDGYFVVAYIGNGLHYGGYTVPFSGKRQRSSSAFYGKCVDKWITITEPIPKHFSLQDPDLLVFVTYPMLKHNFVLDKEAIGLLQDLQNTKASTNVVLITHRTNEALHETLPVIEKYIPRKQLTFAFLGEHTQKDAYGIFKGKSHGVSIISPPTPTDTDKDNYRLAHFYPVLPLHYIGATRSDAEKRFGALMGGMWTPPAASYSTDGYRMQTFSIQGNFGGKHAHRKNVKGTLDCLRAVEGGDMGTASDGTPLRVGIDLVGHVSGEVNAGELKHGAVRFLSDLNAVDYYAAIAKARFMIAAIGEDEYYTSRATSSVPAALIARVPLVTSRRFLDVYPCLRDAKVHKQMAQETECESIAAAAKLTEAEYQEARKEVMQCADDLYTEAKDMFNALGDEAVSRRGGAHM